MLNLSKSSISFSKNVVLSTLAALANTMGISHLVAAGKHLGLPLILPRSKKQVFRGIKENLMKIIAGWKTQLLSQAGGACLIKSVALAMPFYVMSSFLLPQGFCSELDFLVSNFWWGFPMEKKVAWDSGNSLILTKLLFLNWDDRSVTMKRSFG